MLTHKLLQESSFFTVTALVGLKPLVVGGYQVLFFGSKNYVGNYDSATCWALTRATQAGFESFSQVILQGSAMVAIGPSESSVAQHISILWSVVNIASTFASTSYSLDVNSQNRVMHPHLYGWIEDSKVIVI